MDKIKLVSNRSFIIKLFITYMIVVTILLIILIIGLFIDYDNMSQNLTVMWIFVAIDMCSLLGILIAKFYKSYSFIFYREKIEVYNKNHFQFEIPTSNIKSMNYYPFKWHYFITIYAGSLNEGGAWKIHITDYQDKKYALGFIGYKDAKKLQKMYPELEIMYKKKDKKSKPF